MAIVSSGQISIQSIVDEFGGTAPHALSEYYGAASGVPTSGEISISDFYGTSSCLTLTAGTTVQQLYQAPYTSFGAATWAVRLSKTIASNICSNSGLSSRLYKQATDFMEGSACTFIRTKHEGTVYQTYGQCSSGSWSGYVNRTGIAAGDSIVVEAYGDYGNGPIIGWEFRTGNSGTLFA